MRNPLKFLQEVKQEAFRISWPTKKDTMTGALMVFGLATIAAILTKKRVCLVYVLGQKISLL